MNHDTVRLSTLGRLVRERWILLFVYALVGALAGAGASVLFSPGYQSTSSVLLQGPLEEDELHTQALIATSSVVLTRTAAALDDVVSADELRGSVSAEVLEGNVIEITASASTSGDAQRLTERLTQEYVAYSQELVEQARIGLRQLLLTLQEQITAINERIDDLSGRLTVGLSPGSELTQLRTTLAETLTRVEEISGNTGDAAFGRASLVVLEPATVPTAPTPPTRLHLTVGGAALVVLLGLFGHLVSDRANRKPVTEPEIAAALGSPVLGSVDLAGAPEQQEGKPGFGHWARRHLRRSSATSQETSSFEWERKVRYRRVLARLKTGRNANLRVLLVVTEGDVTARRAIVELALASATGRVPTVVVTDDPGFAKLVQDEMSSSATSDGRVTIAPSADPEPPGRRTVLHVVAVDGARPTVPERSRANGAMVVLTAGTRSPWELVGIAEACTDAGQTVLGALVVDRVGTRSQRPGSFVDFDTYHFSTNGSAKAATS